MVSRITLMMIKTNDIEIFDTDERSEAWIMKNGARHALILSCVLHNRSRLEDYIKDIKSKDIEYNDLETSRTETRGSHGGDNQQT